MLLWAKKTPVKRHLVFTIEAIAECAGDTLGQVVTPLFAAQGHLFFAVAIVAILLAVKLAFSEGHLILEVDFEDEDRADAAADKTGSKDQTLSLRRKKPTPVRAPKIKNRKHAPQWETSSTSE